MELLVASAITSILVLGMITVLDTSSRRLESIKLATVRDDLHSEIRRILADERSIIFSKGQANNSRFANCFKTFDQNVQDCTAQEEHPFHLYDRFGTRIAGPETDPVYYDTAGARCTSSSLKCKIKVTTTVRPQGVPDWYTMNLYEIPPWGGIQHDILEIKYNISVEGGGTDQSFRPITGSLVLDTYDWPAL